MLFFIRELVVFHRKSNNITRKRVKGVMEPN